jgi:hypothetical protein
MRAQLSTRVVAGASLLVAGMLAVYWSRPAPVQDATNSTPDPKHSIAGNLSDRAGASSGVEIPLDSVSGDAERSIIVEPALSGRVVDEAGLPVEGAEVAWTALHPTFVDPGSRTEQDAFEEIARSTSAVTSGGDGTFAFASAPPGAVEHPSVVWIVHEGHLAESVLLQAGRDAWTWPPDLRLRSADTWNVVTVDVEGAPVEGATVALHLLAQAYTGSAEHDLAQQARRVFRRKRITDARGRARSCAVPGACFVVASKDELRAPFAYLPERPRAEVTLVLRKCFRASGRVDWGLTPIDPTGADISFAALEPEPSSVPPTWLAPRIGVRTDGTFGPIDLPLVPGSILQTRLDRGPFLQSFDQRAMPLAESTIHLVLEAVIGERLEVRVDDENRKPLTGVFVRILTDREGTLLVPAREERTDADGIAKLLCPDRLGFRVEASLPGYAFESTDPLVWSPGLERVGLVLRKGGVVRGRCVHEGRPVTSFDVNYWTKDVYSSYGDHFSSPEGEFRFEGLPLGELNFFASAPGLPQSPTHSVTIGPEPIGDLVIELGSGVTLRSRVINSADRKPVAEARVQPYSSRGGQILFPNGEPYPVGADGQFELRMVGPEGAGYGVSAEGFATTYGVVPPAGKDALELSTIVLAPYSELAVKIVGERRDAYEGYLVWVEIGPGFPATGFDEHGLAVLAGVHPGGHQIHLRTPEGDELVQSTICRPGRAGSITFDVSGSTALAVELSSDPDAGDLRGGRVVLISGTANAPELRRQRRISTAGQVVFERTKAGAATVEVRDAQSKLLASVPVEIGTGPEQSLRVDLGGKTLRFRIVDREHRPLSQVAVEACSIAGAARWSDRTTSDREGVAVFGPTAVGRMLLSLSHESAGHAWGLEIEVDPAEPAPHEVVLDGRDAIELVLLGSDGPREGVITSIRGRSNSIWQWIMLTSGPDGRVRSPRYAPGEYEIVLGQPGIWPSRTAVRPSGEGKPVAIQVRSTGDLEVRFFDVFDQPVADVALEVRSIEDGRSAAEWFQENLISVTPGTQRSGIDGRIQFLGLPQGTYSWSAQSKSEVHGSCAVAPSVRTTIEVRLP